MARDGFRTGVITRSGRTVSMAENVHQLDAFWNKFVKICLNPSMIWEVFQSLSESISRVSTGFPIVEVGSVFLAARNWSLFELLPADKHFICIK